MKIPNPVKWWNSEVSTLSWLVYCHAISHVFCAVSVVLRGADIQKLEELFIDAEKLDEWPNEHWCKVYFDIQFMGGT